MEKDYNYKYFYYCYWKQLKIKVLWESKNENVLILFCSNIQKAYVRLVSVGFNCV